VTTQKAQAWCQSKGDIPCFETSAKEAVNVEQAFYTIAKNALAQEQTKAPIFMPETLDLNKTAAKSTDSKCCS